MAHFFIDRPVFAWVIAIAIMLVGGLALQTLPVSRYPTIAPPQITITASYPGASAEAVEQTVTQVIEQKMTGLDGLRYIQSGSDSSGVSTITVTFNAGVDPDIAQVQVQNKLALATPQLPQDVQRQGVTVAKGSSGFLMVFALTSPNSTYDQTDLGDYIATNILDPVSRTNGVGSTTLFGSKYAMRIWLRPDRLEQYNLTASEIIAVVRSQNVQVSAGALGGAPMAPGQEYTATITLQSLMQEPEEFEDMPVFTTPEGATVRLGDVANIEIGAEFYGFDSRFNGQPAAAVAVSLASGANALDTADRVKEKITELSRELPADMEVVHPYETTPFVEESIHEVQKTLFEAIVLVFLVIFVFLQSLRATFPPMMAVPVVLLGTFAVMAMAGFSINMLTMFALILAIGLLVDDAIVVVENVERIMHDEGLNPYDATKKSMTEISGALIGIVVVLSAVFVPMAFFPGSTGIIYRQFSLTIVSAMVLSVITALVLTPTICVQFLRAKAAHGEKKPTGLQAALSRPAEIFNAGFDRLTGGYVWAVRKIISLRALFLAIFAGLAVVMYFGFRSLPTSFLPEEDQGVLLTIAQLPSNASLERTTKYMGELNDIVHRTEGELAKNVLTVSGYSVAGRGANQGLAFITTTDWSERLEHSQSTMAMAQRISAELAKNQDGFGLAFVPPAIPELGIASGFDMFLQDNGAAGRDALNAAANEIISKASENSALTAVRPNEQAAKPLYDITIDYKKAQALGVQPTDITSLMSAALGGAYVNDFINQGRIKRVMAQGVINSRMQPEDIAQWRVRNATGQMVPINEVMTAKFDSVSPLLNRFNGLPAFNIQGAAAPGRSSGDAMLAMEDLIAGLDGDWGYAWNGVSFEERESGGQAGALYALSIVFIFLCLAALYESWTVPPAVLLAAPIGVLGAVALVGARGMSNDVFFQVGLLTTVGLAAKNAILIIEFAKEMEEKGKDLIEATVEAARLRLRPILMTSFAFGFGVLPLAIAEGAGAGARMAIGTAVLGGMLASTFLGIFFTPLFYVVIRSLTGHGKRAEATA